MRALARQFYGKGYMAKTSSQIQYVDRSRGDSIPLHLMETLLTELQKNGVAAPSDANSPEFNQVPDDALNLPFGVMKEALTFLRERHECFKRGEIKPENRAIGRRDFVGALVARGALPSNLKYSTQERYLRLALESMRVLDGEYILSTGGKQGGYWLTDNREEAIRYIRKEVMPRVETLLRQATAILGREAMPRAWVQQTLF